MTWDQLISLIVAVGDAIGKAASLILAILAALKLYNLLKRSAKNKKKE